MSDEAEFNAFMRWLGVSVHAPTEVPRTEVEVSEQAQTIQADIASWLAQSRAEAADRSWR
ncbi:MAG: hypothetical protein J6386_19285 [Candidatus Synoicihabitans palmerolidicus]|nr:hypothetical protein [Candidatus Synoicihabitans palmerolidicus]